MEINGVINNPPTGGYPPAGADGASISARLDETIQEMASQQSSITAAAEATRAAVEASSTGDHDAADGARQAIVALSAAIGSPVTAQIVSSAARRSAPIKIKHPAPPTPKAASRVQERAAQAYRSNAAPQSAPTKTAPPVQVSAPPPVHAAAPQSSNAKANVSVLA
jgi:hypothetical protein